MAQEQKLKPAAEGKQQQVAEIEKQAVEPGVRIHFPSWPTSRPGPRVKLPPPGMKPVNHVRPEQVVEIGYNQETGEPGVDSPLRSVPDDEVDQPTTAQDALGKRKQRL